jgi:hypothetical protein
VSDQQDNLENLVEDPQLEEAGWVVSQQGVVWQREDGWHAGVVIRGPSSPDGTVFEMPGSPFATYEEASSKAVASVQRQHTGE